MNQIRSQIKNLCIMVLVLKLILNLVSFEIIIDINEFGGHFFILWGIFLLFIMLRVEAALFAS